MAEIRANCPHNIVACKEQMISRWMDKDSLATPSCWWSLVKAAKGMDENRIVQQIQNDHGKFPQCYLRTWIDFQPHGDIYDACPQRVYISVYM